MIDYFGNHHVPGESPWLSSELRDLTVQDSCVYKYRRADEHALSFLGGALYFSSVNELNDPTDLNLIDGARLQFEEEMCCLYSELEILELEWDGFEEDPIERQRRIKHLKSKIAKMDHRWNDLKHGRYLSRTESMGVLCLTADCRNYRMWTHYADGFRGVCVGLDCNLLTTALKRSGRNIVGPIEVKYQGLTIEDVIQPGFLEHRENLYRFKPKEWAYEEEERFVCRDSSGVVSVPEICIREIIVGNRADPSFCRKVADTVANRVNAAGPNKSEIRVGIASGDLEGRVHIETDELMSSLIETLHKQSTQRSTEADPDSQVSTNLDDDVPF